jgi:hypothetical protein
MRTRRELLLRRGEVLNARKRILVIFGLFKGQIDVEGTRLEMAKVNIILVQWVVGRVFEVEELIHHFDGGQSEGVGQGEISTLLQDSKERTKGKEELMRKSTERA